MTFGAKRVGALEDRAWVPALSSTSPTCQHHAHVPCPCSRNSERFVSYEGVARRTGRDAASPLPPSVRVAEARSRVERGARAAPQAADPELEPSPGRSAPRPRAFRTSASAAPTTFIVPRNPSLTWGGQTSANSGPLPFGDVLSRPRLARESIPGTQSGGRLLVGGRLGANRVSKAFRVDVRSGVRVVGALHLAEPDMSVFHTLPQHLFQCCITVWRSVM